MEATFPPLIPYYVAAVAGVFGYSELALHVFFLIFPLLAAVSMYFILKKYTVTPLLYSLIFVSAPAFLVSSTSIMLDVPLAALMLASIALFIYGVDEDRRRLPRPVPCWRASRCLRNTPELCACLLPACTS